MVPVVRRLETKYRQCAAFEQVNFHDDTPRRRSLRPLGTPEFFLLDEQGTLLYRWFGVVDIEEFEAVMAPLCT